MSSAYIAIGLALCLVALLEVTHGCDLETTVDCSSQGYKYHKCLVPGGATNGLVSVIRKYSKSSCTLGKSYGYKNGHVWVNHGCRAKFSVCSCNKYRIMLCQSRDYKYETCRVPEASMVKKVELQRKISKSHCKSYRYGITGGSIWVNGGCRGYFHVCY